MPIPTPRQGEKEDDFIGRCMGDKTMREEYDQDQRYAICKRQWDERDKDKEGTMSNPKYGHIISMVMSSAWAILPAKLSVILDLLAFRASGGILSDDDIRQRIGNPRVAEAYLVEPGATPPATMGRRPYPTSLKELVGSVGADVGRSADALTGDMIVKAVSRASSTPAGTAIAVLPLMGMICHRMGMMSESSGGTSTERFAQMFRQAMNDPQVGAVVLDADSPGGTVDGIPELSSEIYSARGRKPIVAVANSLAASAAYWLASAADEIVVVPSAQVGSIGVLAAHENLAKAMEQQGIETTLISAGKYKTEGHPFGPLSDEARDAMQSMVDHYYSLFTQQVARNRNKTVAEVREGYGEGRVVTAKDAVKLGMADKMETMDETLVRIARQMGTRSRRMGAITVSPVETAQRGHWLIEGGLSVGAQLKAQEMISCPHTCCVMCDMADCKVRMECCAGCHECCREMCEDCEKDCKMSCCAMCQGHSQTLCAACSKTECSMHKAMPGQQGMGEGEQEPPEASSELRARQQRLQLLGRGAK